MIAPSFAVVGHANKGKSSLVAALALDDSVVIHRMSGTTISAGAFPMRIDGEVLYTLVDTPGFHRARAALAWMQEQAGSADDRSGVVARFVDAHRDDKRFRYERELLKPIIEGAGVLYVVDGSVPYAREYVPEMEILRWTGQPRIAVINPIDGNAYVDDWRRALKRYFPIVRVIDTMTDPSEWRLQVLGAFAVLREDWHADLTRAANALTAERRRARRESSNAVAALVEFALTHREEKRVAGDDDPRAFESRLAGRYRDKLRGKERLCRKTIEEQYRHERLERRENEMKSLDDDLFSEDTWSRFGLSRAGLVKVGVTGGAATGFGVDAMLGGTSMLLGTGHRRGGWWRRGLVLGRCACQAQDHELAGSGAGSRVTARARIRTCLSCSSGARVHTTMSSPVVAMRNAMSRTYPMSRTSIPPVPSIRSTPSSVGALPKRSSRFARATLEVSGVRRR